MIHEQNENTNKEGETIEKSQTDILELNNNNQVENFPGGMQQQI